MTPEDHDILIEVHTMVKSLVGNGQPGRCSRNEERLTALERWQNSTGGIFRVLAWIMAAAVTVGAAAIAAVLAK